MRTAVSFLFLALAAALCAAPAAAQSYAQPRLKAQVVVAGDIVRIGDMIENAGLAADKPIFRAPDLGQTGAVPARAVLDAVRPYGLIAVDARGIVEVVGDASEPRHRGGRHRGAHRRRADRALQCRQGRQPEDQRSIATCGRSSSRWRTAELTLARMSYDPFSRRFDVTFELPGNARAQWRYTGSAVETIEAAVPTRALARGDVIKAGDIVIERRPKNEFSSEPPALAAEVVGQAARRVVRAGQPLRNADLMKPELVQKNDTVMLYYEVPGIVLTMRGKALEVRRRGRPGERAQRQLQAHDPGRRHRPRPRHRDGSGHRRERIQHRAARRRVAASVKSRTK